MPRYRVNHVYASYRDGVHYGPWTPGEEVELVEAVAEWVNQDSPGALSPVVEKQEESVKREATKTPNRQQKQSPSNR